MKWYEKRGIDDDIVISSRITLSRNLYKYDFSPKMTDADSLKLLEEAAKAFYSQEEHFSKRYQFIRLDTLRKHQRAYWIEHRVADEEVLDPERPQALIVSEDETASIWVNGENHLQIQVIMRGRQIGRVSEIAQFLDEWLSKHLTYAYSMKYGHLTTAPADMGTGLHVSFLMRLPMTQNAGLISAISERLIQSGFSIRLIKNISAGDAGNVYEIYNKKTLGITEAAILDGADSFADQLIRQERELRSARLCSDFTGCQDAAYKAYGILKYARKLSVAEAIEYLTFLEQGLSDKVIHLDQKIDIFPLIIELQRESLAQMTGKSFEETDEDWIRAAYIRKKLPEIDID